MHHFKKRELPKFEGELRDFPAFRRDWQDSVAGKFDQGEEVRSIKERLPREVEPDVKNLHTMDEIWKVLDNKYGNVMDLSRVLISGLSSLTLPAGESEPARFKILHREWLKVYNDLKQVGQLSALDHDPTLCQVAAKLPSDEAKKNYSKLRISMRAANDRERARGSEVAKISELAIMNAFMEEEKQLQDQFEQLCPQVKSKPRRIGGRSTDTCFSCGEPGHLSRNCPESGVGGEGDARRVANANMRVKPKACPACNGQHSSGTTPGGEPLWRTRLSACPTFMDQMQAAERAELVEKSQCCALCLDWTGSHQRDNCTEKIRPKGSTVSQLFGPCPVTTAGIPCGKRHNSLLHGSTTKYCNYAQLNRQAEETRDTKAPTQKEMVAVNSVTTLLQVQKVQMDCPQGEGNVFFDSGSDVNLVKKAFARASGWEPLKVTLQLQTTGREPDIMETFAYWVRLIDRCGDVEKVFAYEMESITAALGKIDVSAAKKLFSQIRDISEVERPEGEIDLLIGIQHAGLFPWCADHDRDVRGNLRLLTSRFGTGKVLDGQHKLIKGKPMLQTSESHALSQFAVSVIKMGVPPKSSNSVAKVVSVPEIKDLVEEVTSNQAELLEPQMQGDQLEEHIDAGTRPFSTVSLDLMDPVDCKVNKRNHMKVYPMVFACQETGAVHAEVAHDDTTAAFLLSYDHFTSRRGYPAKVFTAEGDVVALGDAKIWNQVGKEIVKQGTEWEFAQGEAQFGNALNENRVKMVKKTLKKVLNTTIISGRPTLKYAELRSVLSQVANIVNDRPLFVEQLREGEPIIPITVNQLLLGKTPTTRRFGEDPGVGDFKACSAFANNLLDSWWSHWKQQGFASLLPNPKLKHGKRHQKLEVGDVCLLLYDNKVKGTYRLCVVEDTTTLHWKDNIAKTVKVRFRPRRHCDIGNCEGVRLYEMNVAVQRLVLLVTKEDAGEVCAGQGR